jgi:hypothetical protein
MGSVVSLFLGERLRDPRFREICRAKYTLARLWSGKSSLLAGEEILDLAKMDTW